MHSDLNLGSPASREYRLHHEVMWVILEWLSHSLAKAGCHPLTMERVVPRTYSKLYRIKFTRCNRSLPMPSMGEEACGKWISLWLGYLAQQFSSELTWLQPRILLMRPTPKVWQFCCNLAVNRMSPSTKAKWRNFFHGHRLVEGSWISGFERTDWLLMGLILLGIFVPHFCIFISCSHLWLRN